MCAGLSFDSESVFVEIRLPDTVSVYGSYLFVNSSEKAVTQTIQYPFPVDSKMEYPYTYCIKVNSESSREEIISIKTNDGVLFSATFGPKDSVRYHIYYSQKVKESDGRYSLTTTQNWKKPLRYSVLSISIPQDKILRFVSYEVDSVTYVNERLNYMFSFNNFMPVKDLVFAW
jgi:hypothetical protein